MKNALDAFPPQVPAGFSPGFDGPPPAWDGGVLEVRLGGRVFRPLREEDMEALWERVGDEDFGEDERMPYWAELWPASLLLCRWLFAKSADISGKLCLELGGGLGLSALAGSAAGARVGAMASRGRPAAPATAARTWGSFPDGGTGRDTGRPGCPNRCPGTGWYGSCALHAAVVCRK